MIMKPKEEARAHEGCRANEKKYIYKLNNSSSLHPSKEMFPSSFY
jgi:hypothetical protein